MKTKIVSLFHNFDIESNNNGFKVTERPEVINAENHNIMHPTPMRHHLERKRTDKEASLRFDCFDDR